MAIFMFEFKMICQLRAYTYIHFKGCLLKNIVVGNLQPTATQYSQAGNLSFHSDHSLSHIHHISIGRLAIGSFDNSQRQAKYS